MPEKPICGLFGLFHQLSVTVSPVLDKIWQKSCRGHVAHICFDPSSQKNEKVGIFPNPPLNAHCALGCPFLTNIVCINKTYQSKLWTCV